MSSSMIDNHFIINNKSFFKRLQVMPEWEGLFEHVCPWKHGRRGDSS